MSGLDDMKAALEKKLDERRAIHVERTEKESADFRAVLMSGIKIPPPSELTRRVDALGSNWNKTESVLPRTTGLVEISGSAGLKKIDETFSQLFELHSFYSTDRLAYPTVYSTTLEDFYTPMLESYDVSQTTLQEIRNQSVEEAKIVAREKGGGVWGYNLPGKGAYLNGWLFTYNKNIPPLEALSNPELAPKIAVIAIHEKLGHGFLAAYSTLGEVKTRLGLDRIELAHRFGLREAEDPVSSLRTEQHSLIFNASQFLEEGWATWLETFMGVVLFKFGDHPNHSFKAIKAAINSIPEYVPQRKEIVDKLLASMLTIFGEYRVSPEDLLTATLTLEAMGGAFQDELGQPLRYAIGERMMVQAAQNLGPLCVPYAALIAANVTFDLASLGLSDLKHLLTSDPRLNPNARLAAISRLQLTERNNVRELASRASEELNFSIPPEIK